MYWTCVIQRPDGAGGWTTVTTRQHVSGEDPIDAAGWSLRHGYLLEVGWQEARKALADLAGGRIVVTGGPNFAASKNTDETVVTLADAYLHILRRESAEQRAAKAKLTEVQEMVKRARSAVLSADFDVTDTERDARLVGVPDADIRRAKRAPRTPTRRKTAKEK